MRAAAAFAFVLLAPFSLLAQPRGPEFRVNTYTTGTQTFASVAADSAGNFVVVWADATLDGSTYGVFAQRYASGGSPLGSAFRVNTYTTDQQTLPSVAADSAGNFVVVWLGNLEDGSYPGVFGQRYASDGTPSGPEFRVNSFTTSAQQYSAVSVGGTGAFVVVWQSISQDGSGWGIFGQRYASDGAPLGAEFRVNTYTSNTQRIPAVACDSAGGFVVAWESDLEDGSTYGVFAQRYASGGSPLGAEFQVNTYTSAHQRTPSVAFGPGGYFVVVWGSSGPQDGSGYGVFGRRYSSDGTPLASEFQVNTYTTNSQQSPSVARDSSGGFLVVWAGQQEDGSMSGVFAQRYATDGTSLGSEFRVNTYTTANQLGIAVAAGPSDHFVVVWDSVGQDAAGGGGIFGQRYCFDLTAVTVSLLGSNSVCPTGTGGTASVLDIGGGPSSHQWAYRTISGGAATPIAGAMNPSYQLRGSDFGMPGGTPGVYYLICFTTPDCGSTMTSNEITLFVTSDTMAPVVTAPPAATATQTLCQ